MCSNTRSVVSIYLLLATLLWVPTWGISKVRQLRDLRRGLVFSTVLLVMVTIAPCAWAEIIEVAFTGTITSIDGRPPLFISDGRPLHGSYRFRVVDPVSSSSTPQSATYGNAIYDFRFSIGEFTSFSSDLETYKPSHATIDIDNAQPSTGSDTYKIAITPEYLTGPDLYPSGGFTYYAFGVTPTKSYSLDSFLIEMSDHSGAVFDDATEFPALLDLSDFDTATFTLNLSPYYGSVTGRIDSITFPGSTTPEPGSALLFSIGLAGMLLRRSRSRRNHTA